MKNFAIILSGCGVYDGSEIHESVMTMLALEQHHCKYSFFAPDIPQHHVINHITGEVMDEVRNVMVESARITRGNIQPLDSLQVENFDALILPGGFGVAKNLSNYALVGTDFQISPLVKQSILQFYANRKPIGALCIAPLLFAKLIDRAEITIGNDPATIEHITALGAKHQISQHGQVVIDTTNKLVTTPCYMLKGGIQEIYEDASALIEAILSFF